jgi:hypothetical protein
VTERGVILKSLGYISPIVKIILGYGGSDYRPVDTRERGKAFKDFIGNLVGPLLSFDRPALVVCEQRGKFSIVNPGETEPIDKRVYAFSCSGYTLTIIAAVPSEIRSESGALRHIKDTFQACPELVSCGRFTLIRGVPKPEEAMAICQEVEHEWTDLKSYDECFRSESRDEAVGCSENLEEWKEKMTELTGDPDYASGLRDDEAPEIFEIEKSEAEESEAEESESET